MKTDKKFGGGFNARYPVENTIILLTRYSFVYFYNILDDGATNGTTA